MNENLFSGIRLEQLKKMDNYKWKGSTYTMRV